MLGAFRLAWVIGVAHPPTASQAVEALEAGGQHVIRVDSLHQNNSFLTGFNLLGKRAIA